MNIAACRRTPPRRVSATFGLGAALLIGLSAHTAAVQAKTAKFIGSDGHVPSAIARPAGTGAQPAAVGANPSATSIGFAAATVGTTTPQTLTANFAVSGYTGSFTPTAVMHYGHDYEVGTANCTFISSTSETCVFTITFTPTLPGMRKDAIFVYDGATRLASVLVYGIGQAPYAAINPGVVTAITTTPYNNEATVDENGIAYIAQQGVPAIISSTKAGVLGTVPVTGLISPRSISIDGAGVIYTHNDTFDTSIITYDTVTGVTGSFTMPVGGYWDMQTVDQSGVVYSVEGSSGILYRVAPDGTYTQYTLNPILLGGDQITVDTAGNVFVGGYQILEITPANVQTQVNAIGAAEGIAVDAAGILYATRYASQNFGIGELPPGNYATAALGLLSGQSPTGLGLGSDGTVFVGNYTTLDIIDRSQGAIAFGEQFAGTASTQQVVQVLNIGNEPLTVSSIVISGTGFAVTPTGSADCANGSVLQPAAFCQVGVTMTPPYAGTFNGTVSITSNSLNTTATTQSVALSGFVYGIRVVPSPTAVAFGNQQTGTTSAAQAVTLTNQGLLYGAFIGTPSSSNPAFNATLGTCSSALAVAASCQLSVTFAPTTTGAASTTFSVTTQSSGGGPNQTVTFTATGTGAPPAAPLAGLAPTTATFAGTVIGATSAAQSLSLSNTGNAPLTISGITLVGANAGDFAIASSTCGGTLAAGATCNIALTFTPTATGARTATLNVADNAAGSPQTASLTGTGLAQIPQAVLNPTAIAFPATTDGTTAAAQTVRLSNPGTGALTISAVTLVGPNPGDFAISSNNCGSSLAAGANCTIALTFTPTAAGARAATLNVADNATGAPQGASLTGTGIALAPQAVLNPTALAFAATTNGTTSAVQTVRLSNPGNGALTISGVTLVGANAGDFAIASNNCGASLVAGANCTIAVTFTPTAAGARAATLNVADNATGSPQTVSLTGAGVALVPQAVLNPTALAFPATTSGTTSAVQAVRLSNPGNGALTISGISLGGANPGVFALGNSCGTSLAAGASCTISVTFAPSSATSFTATLTVADNATGSPQSVALSGTGVAVPVPQAALSPADLAFAATVLGQTSATQTLSLTNPGTAPLAIASIRITGANAADFTETTTCGTTLAVNAGCTITVSFTPSTVGTESASVSVADNAGSSPQTASLTGTGAPVPAAQASLSPTSLSFAGTTVGSTSASQTVTLSNPGNAPLSLTSISVGGQNPGDFAESNDCGVTLAAAASCTIAVTFTPSVTGGLAATLAVADNASGTPQTVALAGTGDAAPAPNFAVASPTPPQSVLPGGVATYAIVVTPNDGSFTSPVSFSASGLPAGATATFQPATVTPGSGPATTTMTVHTGAVTASATQGRSATKLGTLPAHGDPATPDRWPAAPTYAALALAAPWTLRRAQLRSKRRRRIWTRIVGLCAFGIAVAGIAGCNGGFQLPNAKSNSYTITVTATSGAEIHSTTVTLTVQP